LGNLRVRKISFTYPINAAVQKTDSPLGILGNPFWQNFIVTIDGRFQRIILKPNPFAAIKGEFDSSINFGDNELVTKRQFRTSELSYQRAMILADNAHDPRYQAIALGRLGNLRRVMAHDLQRPEHARASYNYFVKADELARKYDFKDVEGRILGDWSLLYSDNGQLPEAKQTVDKAMMLAPQDANVNVDSAVHLFRSRQYPEAQRYIEKALFLDPSNWQALWYEVKLSEMFNDPAKEKQTLGEILRYFPSSKVASDKLRTVTQTQTPPTPTPEIR
jgi:tetratricopeptide (TPR) repeat protein